MHRQANFELKLEPVGDQNALQLLIRHLEIRLHPSDVLKVIEFTQGQDYIIEHVLHYVQNFPLPFSLAHLQKLIFEQIKAAGMRDKSGRIILPDTPNFKEVKNDIVIVNGNALQTLK